MSNVSSDPIFGAPPVAVPYNGTTGSAGSDTSRTRAEREAADGTAAARQAGILGKLREAGTIGMTVQELRKATGQHHGQVSGSLSSMHKEGLISALKLDRRNGCGVYVLPENVAGRITRKFRPNNAGQSAATEEVAPDRPQLTRAELELIGKIRGAVKASGDSVIRMYPSSARGLLAIIDRLSK
jgi:hypothetical protein